MKILVEGRPGSGKTTVAARLAELLREAGVDVGGFVTHELRERGRRRFRGRPRVGKYGVDLEAFERVALPALAKLSRGAVVVLDELGKMELASEKFRDEVAALFDADRTVVATVHVSRHPLTDALKRRRDIERVRVTHASRDGLPEQLAAQLR